MSAKQYTGLIPVVILSSFVSCLVISKGLLGPATIRASQIDLVDHKGMTRATLDSTGILRLMDDQGRDRLTLSALGGARIQCLNQDGGELVELRANQGDKCVLEFNDSKGKTAVRIGVNHASPGRQNLEVFKNGTTFWSVPE